MNATHADLDGTLADIWLEILGIEAVDPRLPFVQQGGTSIAAEQIASRVREAFGVDLKGAEILRLQTLEAVRRVVAQRTAALASA